MKAPPIKKYSKDLQIKDILYLPPVPTTNKQKFKMSNFATITLL